MDDQNKFINNYKKKLDTKTEGQSQAETPALRFEEKSDFVKPKPADRVAPTSARRLSAKAAIVIAIAVILVLGIVFGLLYAGQFIKTENLIGMSLNNTKLWASDNNIKLEITSEYNDTYDVDKVFEQNVKPDTQITKGSILKIKVSLGHDLTVSLDLPDLKSMTKTAIESWAAENFMTKVRITTEFSDTVLSGNVISFQLNDDTVVDEVKRNTPIYVIVSKGPEDAAATLVTIPDFKTMTVPQCHVFANDNGLVLTIVEQYDDFTAAGVVMIQSVKAADKVARGTVVTLTVSLGKKITVPNFASYSKAQAQAAAAQLGITVSVTEKYSTRSTGAFISQSLAAGSTYVAGSSLELVYSLGNTVVVNSFVGQTKAAIESWANGLNDQGAAIVIATSYTINNSARDQIIYQDKTNTTISIKTTITIIVSLGKVVYAPDFVAPAASGYDLAITLEKALAMCADTGIVANIVIEASAGRLPGEVWYQSVAAGTQISEGSVITLKCNPSASLDVPDFSNLTQAQVIAAGNMNKFEIVFITGDTYIAGKEGKVVAQSIAKNTTVVYGTKITLTLGPLF